MPDQAVILFVFSIVASFGTVWGSNFLRQRFSARYLEQFFLFTLVSVFYGFVNWVLPFIILLVAGEDSVGGAEWAIPVLVLTAVPLLLAKLYLFIGLFQALLGRGIPAWLNYLALSLGILVLALTVISIKSYYDGGDFLSLREFLVWLGVVAIATVFLVLIQCLARSKPGEAINTALPARLLAWTYLTGYAIYVFAAYSSFLPVSPQIELLTPYIYFIIHALPLPLLWYFHQGSPVPERQVNTLRVKELVDESGLTPRETVVLRQIMQGHTNQQIADSLSISPHTVRNHIYHVYRKTGIRNRFQLLAYCQQSPEDLVN